MANAFTPDYSTLLGGTMSKDMVMVKGELVIDTTAEGGAAADDLPASMFGLQKIVACLSIVNDGEDKVFHASPDFTGDSLLVGGGASQALVDLPNDTYEVVILGIA